ncbi:phytoene/squalene synthase family protein [Micrococcus luteus]
MDSTHEVVDGRAALGTDPEGDLRRYTATALRSAGEVITGYSTSFSWACRTLPVRQRRDIGAVYAMVRVADEVVDGTAAAAGATTRQAAALLDDYERRCEEAMGTGFSTDLVLHAFADVARRHGITRELTAPFFRSMRADLRLDRHGEESLADYIHGSAEVVGLMCLQVFCSLPGTRVHTEEDRELLRASAMRLGAAFQKVNFLRDLGADQQGLGRVYLTGTGPRELSEARKRELVAEVAADLDAARPGIDRLDRRVGRAVLAAHGIFAELNRRIGATPAAELHSRRVRVPAPVKAAILARAVGPVGRQGNR